MPELPEVETVVRGLRPRLRGRRICRVRLHQPLILRGRRTQFRRVVAGARIARLERRGKFIVFHLEGPPNGARRWCLIVHLGMTGQLFCCSPREPYQKHTHATFWLDTGKQMRFRDPRRFGRLELIPAARLDAYFAHFGPEILDVPFAGFARRFAGRRAPVKSLLLNQNVLRGLGNIYSDEVLFVARIHPATPADRLALPRLRRLYAAIQRVLHAAIDAEGTSFSNYVTAEGRLGNFQYRLRVYGREGKSCPRCRTPIERIVLSARSSHFCPRCQPRQRRGQPRPGPARRRPRQPDAGAAARGVCHAAR
ncbi:MAG: bifunctional DNA-formamidopyrimidine glycosylase/DNA-(apurinic or apyrimidinic site) lyase [Terriglobia bacterium]